MHAIVDIRTRVIIDYLVTDSVAADINGLYVMLHRLGLGMFCLDSAYLAREMCDMISAMGMVPRIKPKSNTVRNAKGSQPWRGMVPGRVSRRTGKRQKQNRWQTDNEDEKCAENVAETGLKTGSTPQYMQSKPLSADLAILLAMPGHDMTATNPMQHSAHAF